ncbi:MAG: ATP-binding cassette domain-containing protein [Coriobacteriaceae bacterium]|nr:ATP-binding cassette domain-containing protein [Coriobacteriaceae bacterium]MDD7584835.1 ATP-binding cassette domain-containing protein [Coriobacteriaceae bacterium]
MSAVISVRDFSFRYREAKHYAVRHLTFDIEEGSILCVVGSNASGKSTLCSALVGLIPHHFRGKSRGEVRVFGERVVDHSVAEISCNVGFVFQNPFNQLSYTTDTVAEELAYGLCNRGVPRDEMVRRVHEVAGVIRLEGLLDRNPLELSGGQVQRVALGSTLILDPQVLVLDECTTQLDPLGSEEIFDIIKRLNAGGMTIVMVDHDMERVARCADTVLALERGGQVALGTPREVFSDPSIIEHGIDVPDYVRVTRALDETGLVTGPVETLEGPATERVKEALGR